MVEQPFRADVAAGLLVIGEMQFDAARERPAGRRQRLQREQGIRVGGEIGLADRDAPAVHHRSVPGVVEDPGAVGILGPPEAGGYHVPMGIQCDAGPVAETLPHHQIDRGDHARSLDLGAGHGICLDGKSQRPQPVGGHLCVRGAIAGRIVGGHRDQRGEQGAFGLEMAVHPATHEGLQLGVGARCHAVTSRGHDAAKSPGTRGRPPRRPPRRQSPPGDG